VKTKDFGYRGPTPKQLGQPFVTTPAVGLRAPDYSRGSLIHSRFQATPTDQGYLDVRDRAGRRPPFLPKILGPARVLVRNFHFAERNAFGSPRGAFRSSPLDARQGNPMAVVLPDEQTAVAAWTEATAPGGVRPQIATQCLYLDPDQAREYLLCREFP